MTDAERDLEESGAWRRVTGMACNPDTNRYTVFLECGHRIIACQSVGVGLSLAQTDIKKMLCHQCEPEPWTTENP